jgi:hypothetical protein
MTSFPSGHTASSFMAGMFLALYLNAKLKPFGDFHTSFWKMLAVLAPIIGAMFIAGSLVADRVSTNGLPHFNSSNPFPFEFGDGPMLCALL